MALIACPECGKQVSSSAPTCPGCGHPIARPVATPVATPVARRRVVVQQEPSRGGGSGFIVFVVLLLIIGGGVAFFVTQTDAGKKLLEDAHVMAPDPAKVGPATIRLERRDQLPGAFNRHTLWINGKEIGKVANGATNTFEFTTDSSKRNEIFIEAYDPFVENPKSNKVYLTVHPGDEVTANVQWVQNGTAFDLVLEAKVVEKNGKGQAEDLTK